MDQKDKNQERTKDDNNGNDNDIEEIRQDMPCFCSHTHEPGIILKALCVKTLIIILETRYTQVTKCGSQLVSGTNSVFMVIHCSRSSEIDKFIFIERANYTLLNTC